MKRSRSTFIASAIVICLFLPACDGEREDPGDTTWMEPIRLGPDPRVSFPAVTFVDVTLAAGIRFHHATGAFGQKYLPETTGSGVAFLDYDGDEWPDLLFVNSMPWPGHEEDPKPTLALYRNLGNGTFRDVTVEAGLAIVLYGMGAVAADVEGDGDVDIYVTAYGKNLLLVNEGGRFVDGTDRAGVGGGTWTDSAGRENPEWSSGAAFLDYDGDDDLDLFVANYVQWSIETDRFTTMDGKAKAYTSPEVYPGLRPRLFRNRGDGTFEDVSERIVMGENADPKALGVLVTDFDADGRPDIFVTNDTQPNNLFWNRGDGSFEDTAMDWGVAFDENGESRAGMGVGATTLPDGRLVLAVGNFSREAVSYYKRDPSGLFVDSAPPAGLASSTYVTLTFGLAFLDYDLDGLEDLVLANGHIEPTIHEVQKEVTYAQPPQLFRNRNGRRFDEASGQVGADFRRPLVARGLAVADYDRDGDPDLVLSANGGPAMLLRNEARTRNAWLRVKLRMDGKNRNAIGARITVAGGGLDRVAVVRTGGSYLSQDELTKTFGLGELTHAERVTVRWPDGVEETLENVPAGREILIRRGRGFEDLPR